MSVFPNAVQAQENRLSVVAITLNMREVPLLKVLAEIEKQADVRFTYESSLLSNIPPVSFSAQSESLDSCLKRLFAGLPLLYQQNGRYIILKRKPRQVTISGFVRDKASSESLIGASVYEISSRRGTAANNYGFFSVRLNPGDITLQASYVGYSSQELYFNQLDRDTTLIIELESNVALQEIVIFASERERQQVMTSKMGALEINQKTIQTAPTMFGEADIIKTLQLTPGVSVGTEGFTGMYVRGGEVDENLFLIDGNPVYQISHIGGLFSAFNAEAIRGMEFFKGGFPARYGGRLSSVVDVHTKEGNMREFHGSASIGLISGNVSLEGPIVKDRTSFMIAIRRTWLDALTIPAIAVVNHYTKKDGDKARGRYAFHDLNLKLDHRFNDRSKLFFSLYNGKDVLKGGNKSFEPDKTATPFTDDIHASLDWGNLLATAGWTYVFNNKLFGKLSGVFTQYRSSIKQKQEYVYGEKGSEEYEESYNETSNVTGITDFGIRASFDYLPSPSHHIRFGGDAMMHRFKPEYGQTKSFDSHENDTTEIGAIFANELLWGREFSVFAEDDWDISPSLRVNAGLRVSLFNIDKTIYSSLEPRMSVRWLLKDNLSLKASYARMNQYVHLVSENFINLPTDSWMPITARLKPMESDQLSLGAYYTLKGYEFSLEGYYKKMNNVLEYRDGYSFLPTFSSWEDKLTAGEGRSYGGEIMIRKQTGKTTGWIGYTLSWADRKFDEINEGKRFPSKYDNRHKLNLVVSHKLSDKVELTGSWTFASGNRVTLPLESYEGSYDIHAGKRVAQYESLDYVKDRNNYQLPAYHRLDLGINIYRPKKSGNMGIWNVSIYNVYSRMNPFMIRRTTKEIKNPSATSPYVETISVPCFKTTGIMPIIPS
ncbi:TonB-dependent receptor, partial [Parabacteroides sp. OttesenSCG-928-G21]|nr:TonB-dependent receptor [Parabacteroides sp. OttesenSCG-928-G21]